MYQPVCDRRLKQSQAIGIVAGNAIKALGQNVTMPISAQAVAGNANPDAGYRGTSHRRLT
jgi:hypothetical protein